MRIHRTLLEYAVAIFQRICNIPKTNSFFLFGARGTGKTSLLHDQFSAEKILWIDLLDRRLEDRYALSPNLLYDELKVANYSWVVIDEIQKIPKLLDTVHRIIESREFEPPKFALTGSSARKLRHGGANLLAGRAFIRNLYPLTFRELNDEFDLTTALTFGSLPKIFSLHTVDDRNDFLTSYGLTYLKEEVWAEHLVRDLDPFRKFIEIAAQCNGKTVNYANIARDVNAHEKTVKNYFEILEDTLLGFFLEPYSASLRKRQHKSPKFYLFDPGVKRALDRTLTQPLLPSTSAYGQAFEHFIIAECVQLNDYGRKDFKLSYFLTKDGGEIDLVVERPGRPTAFIEIKSAVKTDERDTRYLRSVVSELDNAEAFCLSQDPHERIEDGVAHLHWVKGLREVGF